MGCKRKLLCALVLLVVYRISGWASPLNSKLISLVPPGAAIVAGFENYADPHRHGQLLLSTHSNRLDVADWLAITGVDGRRALYEGIEVASSCEENGMLTEHLLLIDGRFDRERIFKSAGLNGAEKTEYEGEPVMLIQPFTRERHEMEEVRWLVILENRIGILGTPFLVKQALQRYRTHADVDRALREQLAQLPHDSSSWNVLVSSSTKNNIYMHAGNRWAPLVDDAEVVIVGARFGERVRVDLVLHANRKHNTEFFRQKLSSFGQVFAGVLTAGSEERRMARVSVEPNRVRGSIELSKHQFEVWAGQSVEQDSQARTMSRGE